ncbi:MAG: hypothetical protein ACYDAA_08515 [Syntrophales bacterium]
MDQTIGTFNPVPTKAFAYGLGWDSVSEPGLGWGGGDKPPAIPSGTGPAYLMLFGDAGSSVTVTVQ